MKEDSGKNYLSRRFVAFIVAACAVIAALCAALWYLYASCGRGLVPAICATASIPIILILAKLFLIDPYRETERMLTLFSKGYSTEGISGLKWQMSEGVQDVVDRLADILLSDEAVNMSKRQAQYLAMQNQINPHFLYNTLEGIRGEALLNGSDDIAKMTETLSQFFRYTISNLETLVTLDSELANVRNYYIIQEYRFGDRLSLDIAFESEGDRAALQNAKVPKLILQPVVENAIIHGVEGLSVTGHVSIFIQYTGSRVILTVSDNGVGMSAEKLRELNDRMSNIYGRFGVGSGAGSGSEGGIALANVNNRIKLLFGEGYGIAIMSEEGAGTDVEITLPYITRYSDAEGIGP
ncbi:MAG: sensor histidine kinase [Clostridiales Family XIII bacterium]|jgi:two-component system sensor histidine kinase YesM|nr:sensor histidine kinase [Clostridiales Family XIII bacterium]